MPTTTAPEDPNAGTPPDGATPSAETKNTDSRSPVPYDRFHEVNEAKKSLETRLAEYEKAEADRKKAEDKARRESDLEQGKFKEALEKADAELAELKPKAEKADRYEKAVKDMLAARLDKVPDHLKALLAQMEPLAALAWLDANAEQLQPRQAPPTDAGTIGDRGAPGKVTYKSGGW